MKKMLLIAGASLLSFAPYALAQSGFVPLAPIPGLTDISPTSVVNSATLSTFFNNLYKYLIGLAAAIAVIQIVWAGLDIAYFHKDAVSAITDDKGKIYNAILGLVLVLSPVLVFSIINPAILNLSIVLPELKTVSGTPSTQQPTTVTPYTQQPGTTRPGTLGAANNGTCIAFQDGLYPTLAPCAYCYRLKNSIPNYRDPAINNGVAYTAVYACGKSPIACRQLYNGGSNGTSPDYKPADQSVCPSTPNPAQ